MKYKWCFIQISGVDIYNSVKPKVSILCVTYNHARFIKTALESFVSQNTDFPFEIIVDDDCSTDGTQEIIQDYADRYPSLIFPTLRPSNTGPHINGREIYYKARGDYICLCQGDDFFCDTEKLSTQAAFLDSHPDYSLCFHPVRMFRDDGHGQDAFIPSSGSEGRFTIDTLLKRNFIACNAAMYRRREDFWLPDDIMPDDYYIHLLNAQHGKIGFINRVMACYRVHSGGLWYDSHVDPDALFKRHFAKQLRMWDHVLDLYGENPARKSIILSNIDDIIRCLYAIDLREKSLLVEGALLVLRPHTLRSLTNYRYRQGKWKWTAFRAALITSLKRSRSGSTLVALIKLLVRLPNRLATGRSVSLGGCKPDLPDQRR